MADPVKWSSGRKLEVANWLHDELTQTLGDRGALDEQDRRYLSQYRAPNTNRFKDFPFTGAYGYEIPSTAIAVDQLHAKFMQTIHAPTNIWTCEPLNERWVEAAKPMQDFLQWLDEHTLKMYGVNQRVFLEMTKLGTGIYKHGWLYESRPIWTYDKTTMKRVKRQQVRSRPVVDHVRKSDFILPVHAYAHQPDDQGGAEWIAERMRFRKEQLEILATSGGDVLPDIDPVDLLKVMNFTENGTTEYQTQVTSLDYDKKTHPMAFDNDPDPNLVSRGTGRGTVREIECFEIHVRTKTNGKSQDDIVLLMHLPTATILRAVYASLIGSTRPYEVVRYFPGEGFWGIGVCEQTEIFQAIESDLYNQLLNNVVLVNSRGIVARAGSNITPGEPIYPGKIFITDGEPGKDFTSFQMADIYQSLPQAIGMVGAVKDKRNGVGDIQLGQIDSLPGRTPATTMLSLMQEGSRRPDLTIKGLRYDGLGQVGLRVLQHLQAAVANPEDDGAQQWLTWAVDTLGLPEGVEVAKKIQTPMEDVESGLGVSITATSGSANKEVERQNLTALLQLYGSTAQQVIQLVGMAMQSAGTPVGQVCEAAAKGEIALFKRLLEQYDIRNVEEIIPSAQAPAPAGQPGPVGPPAGAGQGAPVAPGVNPLQALGNGAGNPVGAGSGAAY